MKLSGSKRIIEKSQFNKPLLLSKRWSHHTDSGGYHQLCNYLQGDIISTKRGILKHLDYFERHVLERVFPSFFYTNYYTLNDFISELKAYYRIRKKNYSVIHSIYAEDQLNFLLSVRSHISSALVGTFHLSQNSTHVKRAIDSGYFDRYRHLDAAIAVSTSMIPFLEQFVGKGKVFFVPHGIQTDRFTPGETGTADMEDKQTLHVLTVGSHGRDWDTYENVVKEIQKSSENIEFHAVVPKSIQQRYQFLESVHFHTNLNEDSLINAYRGADVLFIPVIDATANNSLLEAISCGTPVISTKTGGISDYIDDRCGWLNPEGDVDAAVKLLLQLSMNSDCIKSKGTHARTRALEFDWKKVADQVSEVHKEAVKSYNWKNQ